MKKLLKESNMKKQYLNLLVFLFCFTIYSQDYDDFAKLPEIVPPTPEVASLGKYIETPVSEFTGIPKIQIPIYGINQHRINYSVNLSYHAQGVKVEEIASRVGMGWNLNAGGVIHRQKRKLPDNVLHGYLRPSQTVEDLSNALINPPECSTHEYVVNLFEYDKNSQRDFEPDTFTFSFGGYSGKFYYHQVIDPVTNLVTNKVVLEDPSTPLKIEWIGYGNNAETPSFQQNYNYFIITTPDGIQYYFGVNKNKNDYKKIYKGGSDIEDIYSTGPHGSSVDETESGNHPRYVSTWHLMEIYDPISDSSITFEYEEFKLGRLLRRLSTSVITEFKPNINLGGAVSYKNQISEQYETEYVLSRINYKQGSVNFISDTQPRSDLNGAYALKQIEVRDINDKLVKSFGLDYFYSYNTSGSSDTDISNLYSGLNDIYFRLFISELKEYEINNHSIISNDYKSYGFKYSNPNQLPHRFSTAQDFWGFHNGENNENLMPTDRVYLPNGQLYNLGEANRNVNETHAQDGVLTKITYPTKGTTEYIYENNRATKDISTQYACESRNTIIEHSSEEVYYHFSASNNGNSTHIPSDSSPQYIMYFEVEDFESSSAGGNSQNVEFDYNHLDDNYGYRWIVELQKKDNQGAWNNLNYSPSLIEGINNKTLAPGEYRVFMYWDDEDGEDYSYYPDADDNFHIRFTLLEPTKQSDLNYFITGGLRIKEIISNDLNGNVHSTMYSYVDENGGTTGNLVSLPYRFSDTWYIPDPSLGSLNFKILKEYSSETSIALATTQASYTGYTQVTKIKENGNNGKEEFNFSFERNSCSNFSAKYRLNPNLSSNEVWAIANTPLINEEIQRGKLLSKIDFNAQGDTIQKKVNIYELNTFQETQAYALRKWGQPGSTLANAILNGSSVGGSNPNTCNNIGSVINEYTLYSRSNLLRESTSTTYDTNGNSPITTSTNYYYENDDHLQPTKVVTTNSKGETITQETGYAHDVDDQRLIDEHRITVPIRTKVFDESITLSETLTDYEDDGGLYLPKYIQTSKNGNNPEDRIIYHHYDDKGNPLEVSKEGGAHICYLWGYNKQFPIAKIENATYSEVASQVGTLQSLSNADDDTCLDSGSCDEKNLRNALTTLRNTSSLSDALVTTYTYDPLVGVTSMTDPRGYTIYYEYDGFNRLKEVRDADGKLVTDYQYNYRGQ